MNVLVNQKKLGVRWYKKGVGCYELPKLVETITAIRYQQHLIDLNEALQEK